MSLLDRILDVIEENDLSEQQHISTLLTHLQDQVDDEDADDTDEDDRE
jgi:hypothetical protein